MIDKRDVRTEEELINDNKRYPEAINFTENQMAVIAFDFLQEFAPMFGVKGEITLFIVGSRANNTNSPFSDFDIKGVLENMSQYDKGDLRDFEMTVNKECRKHDIPLDLTLGEVEAPYRKLLTKTIDY